MEISPTPPLPATTQTASSEPAHGKQDRIYHTVADAALHWGDPKLSSELCRLSELRHNDQTLAAILGTETPADRRANRYCRILDDLRCDLIEKLCSETLVAIAFTGVSSPSAERERIHPGRWRTLVPDFDDNSATGGGLNLFDILVTTPLDPAPSVPIADPVRLSPDGRQLRVGEDEPILFRSHKQISAIRKLVTAHQAGELVRAADITDSGNFSELFGGKKWARLRPYFENEGGLWKFKS